MTTVYEINTLVWLGELSARYGRRVTLGDVPGEVWDSVVRPGVDMVWLMGVAERSPAGLQVAMRNEEAAVAVATLPGATLWHDGQFEGYRVHLPVFLARRPEEPVDESLRSFYERLVAFAADVRKGDWQLLDCTGWPDNDTERNLLAWAWTGDDQRYVVVVNYSDQPAEARVRLPWSGLRGQTCELAELLDTATFERSGDELIDSGLYVGLDPWHWHLLAVR